MPLADAGVVAIGRNEAERLSQCLRSALSDAQLVVYVDSGSTDGSVELARGLGVETVVLRADVPFTAARARNEGVRRMREIAPRLSCVQFVDGDCMLVEGWLSQAVGFLQDNHAVAVVCGRRRERYPHGSIYNMLCDIEWDTPIGKTRACGGDALVRTQAFDAVGGFRADLIAGEEPELCLRLRAAGWLIWRVDADMTVHDAAMTRFSQWWKRCVRTGYSFAQAVSLHGTADQHGVRGSRSAAIWAAGVPVFALFCAAVWGPKGWLVLGFYPLQVIRLVLSGKRSIRQNWWHAVFLVLGKFPELQGQIKFLLNRFSRRQSQLIEYK